MKSSVSKSMGSVFTPLKWAEFAIEKFGLFHKWMNGATVLDPTMGEGNLLISLIEYGLRQGYAIDDLPVRNLFGVELNADHYKTACTRLKNLCGKRFRKENFHLNDILFCNPFAKFDIVFGNPPWINFSALPQNYRENLKPLYIKYGLALSGRKLLLGNSQINIAALIIFRVIADFMKERSSAVVFMPMSVLFHSGAHHAFTSFQVGEVRFCVEDVINLENTDAFPGVSTKFGILSISRDMKQKFPVSFRDYDPTDQNWVNGFMVPFSGEKGPMQITKTKGQSTGFRKIKIPHESKPRQGVNTCGANHIFFFNSCESAGSGLRCVSNSAGSYILPEKFIFPLIDKDNFRSKNTAENKFLLLPYSEKGKPLSELELRRYPELYEYIKFHRQVLMSRKGRMIGKFIEKGFYWALLGVGIYNFYPSKIVWEACGKTEFRPMLFEGKWQVNQSLQTYIPFKDKKMCDRVFQKLHTTGIECILKSMNMGGSMCYAQPGIMNSFFEYY